MKTFPTLLLGSTVMISAICAASDPAAPATDPRPLRKLDTDYFPLHFEGTVTPARWELRKHEIRDRVLLASGLMPLPTKAPLKAVIHGRVERDDYTIDRVFFESFPGHYVTGSLYRPKQPPPGGLMPGILCPHGHWPGGRFMDNGAGTETTLNLIAIGAERFESGARAPLQARCVQLARMGCAVFLYDALGYADSIQITEHRSGRRPELNGVQPGTYGLYSPMADLRLQSNFGLQTWNSVRALDFLLSLPGVDPSRVSCTGASGGATQTMMLAAIDDRLTTAFPCVMISTAMQGGCTCENGNYLRIGQGNIDIAAAFAPKPMGMTAADDWTRELETKGYPDLLRIWTELGHPENLTATFNTHWKHNYNHVSRTTMYGFMNRHFALGFREPVLERDFVVSTPGELTVWTAEHPRPAGNAVGAEHEKTLLKHWSEDSDRLIAGRKDILAKAWSMIVDASTPVRGEVTIDHGPQPGKGDPQRRQVIVRDLRSNIGVPSVLLEPPAGKWNGTTVIWIEDRSNTEGQADSFGFEPEWRKMVAAGVAIMSPTLYLAGAREQPMNPVRSQDAERNEWRWAAAYTYGYNLSLFAHRVRDVMNVVAGLESGGVPRPSRILLAGTGSAGEVAAAAAAMMPRQVHGAVIDTAGFRFASLDDQWHPRFVPGAVKYGDLPGLLELAGPVNPVVLGENGVAGGTAAVVDAILRMIAPKD